MPVEDRDYVRGKHPPTCTCTECTNKRLSKFTNQKKGRARPSYLYRTSRPRFVKRLFRKIPLGVHKFVLSLLVIIGFIDLVRRGHFTFTQQGEAIRDTIIFLVELALWFGIIALLRKQRYKHIKPQFKLTFISVLIVILVCAFAGIEPLSSYKDNLFDWASDLVGAIQAETEAGEEGVTNLEASNIAVDDNATDEQIINELSLLIYDSINTERTTRGLGTLQINSTLTSLAEEHSREMATYDYFSHDRMPGSRSFDWNLAPGAGRGENIFMMPQQLAIPGPVLEPEELSIEITRGWMESPGHRQNILESRYTYTGIGIAKKGIYYYITQIFEGQW